MFVVVNIFFSGAWGRNFVGNVIGIILIIIKQVIVHRFEGMYIRGQGIYPRKTRTFIPHEQ